MFRVVLTFTLVTLFSICAIASAASVDRALIILKSDSYADTEATIDALVRIGARAQHVIPPKTVIAIVPAEVEAEVRSFDNVAEFHRSVVPVTASLDSDIKPGVEAWNFLITPRSTTLLPDEVGMMLSNDTYVLPKPQTAIKSASQSQAPGYNDTSDFMIGKIALGLVLPESIKGTETWSSQRMQTVFNHVVAGMDWWATQGGPSANMTFYYDTHLGVLCNYEPITMNNDSIWISDVLGRIGYTSGSSSWDRAGEYINHMRNTLHTDWGFVMLVADSLNDADGVFPNGLCAYAWIGGPITVLTYDNDGWGIENFYRVAAHETGHIFGCSDEYGYCGFGPAGYLGVDNGNCENNNPNSVPCMMRGNDLQLCAWTPGQLGWRDSDGDGIYDPIDNEVSNIITSQVTSLENGIVTITGTAKDIPCHSPYGNEVTINKIASVRYRADGGEWFTAQAVDGAFDLDVEEYTFTTPALGPGMHTIEIEAFSTSGNSGIAICTLDPTPPVMGQVTDEGDYTYDETRMEARWSASDPESEVVEYAYAIGTSPTDPGSGYVKDWTSAGPSTNVAVTGLSLTMDQTYYFYVKAKNSSGAWSEPVSSDGVNVGEINIGQARYLEAGRWVALKGKAVNGSFGSIFYIQEPDRSAGIGVSYSSMPNEGDVVTVRGRLARSGVEYYLNASSVETIGSAEPVKPVFMTNKMIGGHLEASSHPGFEDDAGLGSLYNIGLLVKTSGRVTYLDPAGAFAYIDDGSNLTDGNELGAGGTAVKGIRVILPDGVEMPPPGVYVYVTGVSVSCWVNLENARVVSVRSQEDISVLPGAVLAGKIDKSGTMVFDHLVESEHPYTPGIYYSWMVSGPAQATEMRAHFTKIEMEQDQDFLYLLDANYSGYQSWSNGEPIFDVWSKWVSGNRFILYLSVREGTDNYGFQMDKYEAYLPSMPVAGVLMTLTPGPITAITDANGMYSFGSLAPGTYTITPSMEGITFTPSSITVTVSEREFAPGLNFTGN